MPKHDETDEWEGFKADEPDASSARKLLADLDDEDDGEEIVDDGGFLGQDAERRSSPVGPEVQVATPLWSEYVNYEGTDTFQLRIQRGTRDGRREELGNMPPDATLDQLIDYYRAPGIYYIWPMDSTGRARASAPKRYDIGDDNPMLARYRKDTPQGPAAGLPVSDGRVYDYLGVRDSALARERADMAKATAQLQERAMAEVKSAASAQVDAIKHATVQSTTLAERVLDTETRRADSHVNAVSTMVKETGALQANMFSQHAQTMGGLFATQISMFKEDSIRREQEATRRINEAREDRNAVTERMREEYNLNLQREYNRMAAEEQRRREDREERERRDERQRQAEREERDRREAAERESRERRDREEREYRERRDRLDREDRERRERIELEDSKRRAEAQAALNPVNAILTFVASLKLLSEATGLKAEDLKGFFSGLTGANRSSGWDALADVMKTGIETAGVVAAAALSQGEEAEEEGEPVVLDVNGNPVPQHLLQQQPEPLPYIDMHTGQVVTGHPQPVAAPVAPVERLTAPPRQGPVVAQATDRVTPPPGQVPTAQPQIMQPQLQPQPVMQPPTAQPQVSMPAPLGAPPQLPGAPTIAQVVQGAPPAPNPQETAAVAHTQLAARGRKVIADLIAQLATRDPSTWRMPIQLAVVQNRQAVSAAFKGSTVHAVVQELGASQEHADLLVKELETAGYGKFITLR